MENKTLEKLVGSLDFNELEELNCSIQGRMAILSKERSAKSAERDDKIWAELKKSSLFKSLKTTISIQVPVCIGTTGDCIDVGLDTDQSVECEIKSLIFDTAKYKELVKKCGKINDLLNKIEEKYNIDDEYIFNLLADENIVPSVDYENLV